MLRPWKRNCAVGLELDTHAIRVAEIKKINNNLKVRWAHADINPAVITAGVVGDPPVVAQALRGLWERAKIKSRSVVLGVFNQGVLMRLIDFPMVPPKHLAKAIWLQADDYFPVPLEQLVMDYVVLGSTKAADGDKLQILLVAAQKEMLERSAQALILANLQPKIVDVLPLALMRLLPSKDRDMNIAVLHLAPGWGWLLLICQGVPVFARVLAEVPDFALGNSCDCPAHMILEEVKASLGYYCQQINLTDVDTVYISGLGARDIVAGDLWPRALGVPVLMLDSWGDRLQLTSQDGADEHQSCEKFAICTGLALRGLEPWKNAHPY